MKQKPDEMPDEWVRQALSQLPDAPPPGSTFDTERLWAQLRPELDTMPVRRPFGWAWWAAAACLSGLILGWFLLRQPADERTAPIANKAVDTINTPTLTHQIPHTDNTITSSQSAHSEETNRVVGLPKNRREKEIHRQSVTTSIPEPTETVAQLPEVSTATEVPSVIEKLAQPEKINVAAVIQKRRFQVVHQNELRAEEEARPKLYRAEHFVRIGTGQPDSPTPEERQPVPIMSLTNKLNQ